jgi:hypothetical protein
MDEIKIDELDDSMEMPQVSTIETPKSKTKKKVEPINTPVVDSTPINCLRNVKVRVRHINKQTGLVSNPKHVLYGGMAETAVRIFTVPMSSSGRYVSIMTDEERECIEKALNLPYNALNPYAVHDNFWDDDRDGCINQVRLTKQDTVLDLSKPEDYIKYKILLANKNLIAPSLSDLQATPKASYQFVIVEDGEEDRAAKSNMSATMECYKEYGKFEEDVDKLRFIIETMDGRPTSPNSKLEFLQSKINELIQSNAKMFLSVIKDKYIDFKIIIKQAVDANIVSNRAGYFYMKADNTALCEVGEEPTLVFAAKYIANPRHQDVLFAIQAKLKK